MRGGAPSFPFSERARVPVLIRSYTTAVVPQSNAITHVVAHHPRAATTTTAPALPRDTHTHESILRPHPSCWSSLPSEAASEQKKTLMGEEFIEPLSTCVYAPPHLSRVSIIKPRVLCSVCTHPALLPQTPPLRMCAVLFDRSIVRQSAEVAGGLRWRDDQIFETFELQPKGVLVCVWRTFCTHPHVQA